MSSEDLSRRIMVWAAITGAVGVILGAYSAHGLENLLAQRGWDSELLAKRLGQFDVGVRYHLMHSVALLGLSGCTFGSIKFRRVTAILFLVGILLFSGSLYALVFMNQPKLGAVTPIGGLSWIVAWLSLIGLSSSRESSDA